MDWVREGDAADRVLRTEQFDLLLLDLGLPRKGRPGGTEIFFEHTYDTLPVLIITAS